MHARTASTEGVIGRLGRTATVLMPSTLFSATSADEHFIAKRHGCTGYTTDRLTVMLSRMTTYDTFVPGMRSSPVGTDSLRILARPTDGIPIIDGQTGAAVTAIGLDTYVDTNGTCSVRGIREAAGQIGDTGYMEQDAAHRLLDMMSCPSY